MIKTYQNPVYDYFPAPELGMSAPLHHPVIIIGAGPCGMAAALDFAAQGIPTLVLDDNNTVSVGSRAICFSKRTLEIMDRYGCADPMVDKGVTWQTGKVYFRDELLYEFNLLPESGHKMPAFINLQQYYFEEYMVNRCKELSEFIDLRWLHKVIHVETSDSGNVITVDTQDGSYQLQCDYLLVADGANSPIRSQLGLESKGQVFEDHFLIADMVIKTDMPAERRFWFDPHFHPNQSVLLHKQADNVWRIDFQLGWNSNKEEAVKEENIIPRVRAMFGDDIEFKLEWASVYTFQCRKMDDFIHHRTIFIGDAAHQVSPFGARGANGGIQSVENLAWKIVRILRGEASAGLLETYNTERQHGAAENILNSTRSTDFITPKSHVSKVFRNETLKLAKVYPFARALINSGRLSVPCQNLDSPLITVDQDDFFQGLTPGTMSRDAPLTINGEETWLLNQLGNRFVCLIDDRNEALSSEALQALSGDTDLMLLVIARDATHAQQLADADNCRVALDNSGTLTERYDLQPGTTYLFRPDQMVAARWRTLSSKQVHAARQRALGFELGFELNNID